MSSRATEVRFLKEHGSMRDGSIRLYSGGSLLYFSGLEHMFSGNCVRCLPMFYKFEIVERSGLMGNIYD